jgi:hypothetical protein
MALLGGKDGHDRDDKYRGQLAGESSHMIEASESNDA